MEEGITATCVDVFADGSKDKLLATTKECMTNGGGDARPIAIPRLKATPGV